MVNMKKIGAIATGALFIGATFGMASAVTVPSGIASKLASGGVAKAQLVVGADAPGMTADTESAQEIADAVKAKLIATVGGDLSIDFAANELHDDSTSADDYSQSTLTAAGYADASVNALNTSAVLRFDGNADADLKDDPDDYDLYNNITIIDRANGDIQFAYQLTPHATYSAGSGAINAGDVVTIKGDKYVVTENKTSDNNIELGPAIVKTLTADTVDKDNAVVISGTKKILYGIDQTLRFYDAGSQVESAFNTTVPGDLPYLLTSNDITSDEFKPYSIYLLSQSASQARVTIVEKSQVTKLSNDEEGVMGYSKIKIDDTDWFDGGTTGIFLLSDPISLVKGDTIDLADTYYQLKYTASKQFDIKRKKTTAVASGTKLKTTTEPGSDFLNEDITVSTTGGTSQTEGPELSIVDEDTADTSMNLVLIGGPVANTLTSDLVTNGKSKVDWYTSEGDVEVISSAFKSAKYGIIVAGADRTKTKDAAAAVAGALD